MTLRLKPIIITGLVAGVAYKLYQNRQAILDQLKNTQEVLADSQVTLAGLKGQSKELTQQTEDIKKIADNLNYKIRVFEQESKPHLEAIQAIVSKYQKKEVVF